MKKAKKQRGIFSIEDDVPENDEERLSLFTQYESAEDRVRENLVRAQTLCEAWVPGSGKPGSDEMVEAVHDWAHFLRGELEVETRRNPWRIADYAMTLAKCWRDLEANEALFRPLDGKRRSADGLSTAREHSVAKRLKITLRKYKSVSKRARSRKELASLLGCSLQTVRTFEAKNKMSQS